MLIRRPHYYGAFSCLAGACPDTCCAVWDVVVDAASLERYRALEGPLGDRIQAALTVDGDGDTCFRLTEGRCAMLRPDGLCAIQAQLGEAGLSEVCRAHPRFIEEFGPFREESLGASCPAAAKLMLFTPGPARLVETLTPEEETVCADVDRALLDALLPCRDVLFKLLQDGSMDISQRMAAALGYAWGLQERLDQGDISGLAQVVPPPPPAAGNGRERLEAARTLFDVLGGLELLSQDWKTLLAEAGEALSAVGAGPYAARRSAFVRAMAGREAEYEHFAFYLLYRWFLKADFDGDGYGKVSFAALSLLALQELGALTLAWTGRFTPDDQVRLVGLWCKEQEHCDENLAALAQAAYELPCFAPETLGRALQV